MYEALFSSTTIPVLEDMVNFTQTRQALLAGNIANLDTPGYQARDLSVQEFQTRLKQALEQRTTSHGNAAASSPSEAYAQGVAPSGGQIGHIAKDSQAILRHDLGKVDMEQQTTEMAKNQMQHNLALQIMIQQFRLLQTAVSGRL